MKKDSKSESSSPLRPKAEALAKKILLQPGTRPDDVQIQKLIQELELHQIELELQNQELLLAKEQITSDAEKYAELYDFAPSGYFTLSNDGEILEVNLCGAQILGNDRSYLKNKKFGLFVNDATRPVFNHFVGKIFSHKSKETCEVALQVNSNPPMYVNLSGTVNGNGEQCLVIATDITNHKKAEAELLEKQFQYYNLANSGNALTWTSGKDKLCNYFNESWLKFTGRTIDQEIGNGWVEGVHPEDFARCLEIYMTAFDHREPFEMEYRLHHASGEYRWIVDIGTPNYNSSKEFIGYIGNCFDITERKKAEEALRESEETFRAIIKASPDDITITDMEGRILMVSPMALTMLRYDREEELLGHSLAEFLVPEDLERAAKNIDLMKQGILPGADEYRGIRKDGSIFDMDVNGQIIEVSDSQPSRIIFIVRDITGRKQSEEKIRNLGLHFKALIENAPDGIVLLDAEGNFKFISPAAKKISGFQSSEEIIGNPADYTHPDDLNMVLSALSRIIEDPSYVPTLQYRYRDKTGSWLWVESTFTNLLADPSVGSILINFRNITDQKQAEEKFLHVTRLYAFLGQVNKAIVRNRHENELFHMICNVAVEYGQFRMAWIGVTDEADERIKPVAFSGFDDGYLDSIQITANDGPTGKGPSGQALRKSKVVICNDISADPLMLSWRKEALRRGYRSSASVPFSRKGKLEGTLNIYSAETGFFIEDQVKLLEEIGANISFALEAITSETERRETFAMLGESEKQYTSLFNNFLDSVAVHQIVLDETGKPVDYIFIQANGAFETQTGLRIADIIGKRVTEVIPGIEKTPLIDIYGNVALSGEPVIFEQYFEPLQRCFHINAFRVGEGRFCTVFQDITDTRSAEKALEESEERFRSVFENSVIGKSITSLDGKLQVNQAFCEMLGYSKDQLSKMDWPSITHPDDVEKNQEITKSILSGERTNTRWEKRYIHQNGSIIWADISTTLQRDKEGKPLFFNTSVIDLTGRKQLENDLLNKVEELEHFNNLAVGREIRMVELKQIINELSTRLGLKSPYNLTFLDDAKNISE